MRLYEVVQILQEYNQGATLNKWGERIAKAAKFGEHALNDMGRAVAQLPGVDNDI